MSTSSRYLTLDVFTSKPFGGNQLAVFPDASGIPEQDLQRIAREFNFSEVTFCYPPSDPANTLRVRIFTPAKEIPFAGHPTIGTAVALALGGDLDTTADGAQFIFELGVGPVPVSVRKENPLLGWAELSVAKLPEVGPHTPTLNTLAEILSLQSTDLLGGAFSPQALSCGQPFLIVPLKNTEALSNARVKIDRWENTLRGWWAPEILVVAENRDAGENQWSARMFAPGLNITEDPATGSAIACLGGYLATRDQTRDGTLRWSVTQGVEMGRPSRLTVTVDKKEGSVAAVRVAGDAVLVSRGELVGGG